MTDITFDLDGTIVNLRAGAFIFCGDLVLLCRLPEEQWWFVPGGRIRCGETSLEALRRELSEEVAGDYRILQPLLTSENFFSLAGRSYHEHCIYYAVRWDSDPSLLIVRSREVFEWVRRGDLSDYVLKPAFIVEYLRSMPGGLSHVVHRDPATVGPGNCEVLT